MRRLGRSPLRQDLEKMSTPPHEIDQIAENRGKKIALFSNCSIFHLTIGNILYNIFKKNYKL